MKKENQKSIVEYVIAGRTEVLGTVYKTEKGRIITLNNRINIEEPIEILDVLTGEMVKEVDMITLIEDVLSMDNWNDFMKQVPPLEQEIEIKFLKNGKEYITKDELLPMINGTYIWAYGDYSDCEVIAWRSK